MRLLLTDDDPEFRDLLEAVLVSRGHEVSLAEGGAKALEALDAEDNPLLLLDWAMPGVSGLEVLRRLRTRATTRYVYVIVLTARDSRETYLEAMAAGADDFLSKPLDLDVLESRLRLAERVIALQTALDRFRGFLSVCMYCNDIRDEDGEWKHLGRFLDGAVETHLSHGCCPKCVPRLERDFGVAEVLDDAAKAR